MINPSSVVLPAPCRVPRVGILGIGAQKAGTTWLHGVLGAHPEIFMARGEDKDLRFFNAHYDRGYAWYERHFAPRRGTKLCGEFSTSYFYCQDAPERVHRYNPDVRLLLSLRDPVQRLVSHHKHEIRVGRIGSDVPLERGIEENPSYVEQSLYFTQLRRWLEHFPLSSFHIIIFEELFRDPENAVRGLYAFVGASPRFTPQRLSEKVNEGRIPRSRLVERSTKLSSSAFHAVGAEWVVDSLKKAGLHRWVERRNTRRPMSVDIDSHLRERLRARFAPENAKLARLLGRDLSLWHEP